MVRNSGKRLRVLSAFFCGKFPQVGFWVEASLPVIRRGGPGENFWFWKNCFLKIQEKSPFFFSGGLEKSEKNFQRKKDGEKCFLKWGSKIYGDRENLFFFFGSESKKFYFKEKFLKVKVFSESFSEISDRILLEIIGRFLVLHEIVWEFRVLLLFR